MTEGRDPGGLLSDHATANGHAFDTLSALIMPRRLLAALTAAIRPFACICEKSAVTTLDAASGSLDLGGTKLSANRILVAAGVDTPEVLRRLGVATEAVPTITGVKGQAALLRPGRPLPADLPMVYGDGLYLVPHADGTIGLGSTSEKSWADPLTTDARLDDLVAKALVLCPLLKGAVMVERWAQLRPKGPTANPVVGRVAEGIAAASGGYKTGLALAPSMAREALSLLA